MAQLHQPFAHLHVHSEYSLLDGLSRIDQLAARASELNMPALALTDHGTMHGTIQFYRACKKHGVKPILGVETYVASRRMQDRDPNKDRKRYHLLLLAINQAGYHNLLKIVSTAQLEGYYYKPRTDHKFLEEHSEGLVATTGCLAGEIPQAILNGNRKRAQQLMGWYLEVFGRDRFFVELQEHGISELTDVNKTLIEMAGRYKLNVLATNDVHYTLAKDAGPHDVLLCIQTGKMFRAKDRMRMSDSSYYLKSYAEMHKFFSNISGALDNSLLVAEMCDVDPEPPGYHLPQFTVPDGFTPDAYLRQLCEDGLVSLYGEDRARTDKVLRRRLDYELDIIHDMGFDAYFLIVWDLCEFARERDIWWNVRGSGAGSVVAYTLGITGIDPLANGLIFERFLNPGRVSMPDIDLDYPDDRRQEMIEYTIRKYGSDKVAQIITFGTMGARAAIRDVGRVLDVPLAEVDTVARLIPAIPGKPVSINNVLDKEHEFFSSEFAERYRGEEQVKELVDTARNLEGVARHASTHAAGVIISDRPLVDYTPLHRPTSGNETDKGIGVVTQWPMEILDSIGLLKVDFLGLSTLTVLRKAAELIEKRHNIRYMMENIPYDVGQLGPDPAKKPEDLFMMLGRGEVAGVFQVEGAGMRRLMMKMKPNRFDHIIAAISLYRPGPMENIPEYIERMHGRKEVSYHHPDLEPILQDTYGILVYQEQIIRIAAELAGYAPGEADMIRKAVAKKKRDLMDKHQDQFTSGAMARGYSEEACQAIWGDIEFFARYGFNKAHAADYAVITCQTAFLKAHYPVEYMTALLSVERNNSDKVAHYLAEARRMEISVVPSHINKAELDFSIEDNEEQRVIRYGLGAIKNVSNPGLIQILDERSANGPYEGISDLSERVDLRSVGKRTLEAMIKVGTFDAWGSRPQLLDGLDRIISHSSKTHEATAAGQMSLFNTMAGTVLDMEVHFLRPEAELPTLDRREVLSWEKELIGAYISEHPLTAYLKRLQDVATTSTAELDGSFNGRKVTTVGLLTYLRNHVTKKGDSMAFGTLEDLQGTVELVFFPSVWKEVRSDVNLDRVYLIRGKVSVDSGDRAKIMVDSIDRKLIVARENADKNREFASVTVSEYSPDVKESLVSDPKITFNLDSPVAGRQVNNEVFESIPVPPPNFEDDQSDWDSTQINPPVRLTPTNGQNQTRIGNDVIKEQVDVRNSGNDGGLQPAARIVVVDIPPDAGWQEKCLELVRVAEKYEGEDSLRICVEGQGLMMDFPNQNTHYCPQLINDMDQLQIKVHVEVV